MEQPIRRVDTREPWHDDTRQDSVGSTASSPHTTTPLPDKRPVHRARQACLGCRLRKVRCDVTERSPCGNCQWADKQCIVWDRRRNKKKKSFKGNKTPACIMDQAKITDPNASLPAIPIPTPCLTPNASRSASSVSSSEEQLPTRQSPSSPRSTDAPCFINMPKFIKPLENVSLDDMAVLYSKAALDLPNRAFQDALLKAFFDFVHPYLPVVDLDGLLKPIGMNSGKAGQVSLLLLQSVFAAGAVHVPAKHFKDAGFLTRKEARDSFAEKAKLLHDFQCEEDQLTLVQAMLLMTVGLDTPEEQKMTSYWLYAAISQAFAAGLHIDPLLSGSSMSQAMQRARRRIWWSCYIRDRMVSLSTRRLPMISEEDFDLSKPEEADFLSENADGEDRFTVIEILWPYAGCMAKRRDLAQLCVAHTTLCRSLRFFFRPRETLAPTYEFSESFSSRGVLLGNDVKFVQDLRDILHWYSSLPHCAAYQPISPAQLEPDGDVSIALSRVVLHLIYHQIVLWLYRSRLMLLSSQVGGSPMDSELCKVFMQDSAKRLSAMLRNIHEHGLDAMLPRFAMSGSHPRDVVANSGSHSIQQPQRQSDSAMSAGDETMFDTDLTATSSKKDQSVSLETGDKSAMRTVIMDGLLAAMDEASGVDREEAGTFTGSGSVVSWDDFDQWPEAEAAQSCQDQGFLPSPAEGLDVIREFVVW